MLLGSLRAHLNEEALLVHLLDCLNGRVAFASEMEWNCGKYCGGLEFIFAKFES